MMNYDETSMHRSIFLKRWALETWMSWKFSGFKRQQSPELPLTPAKAISAEDLLQKSVVLEGTQLAHAEAWRRDEDSMFHPFRFFKRGCLAICGDGDARKLHHAIIVYGSWTSITPCWIACIAALICFRMHHYITYSPPDGTRSTETYWN